MGHPNLDVGHYAVFIWPAYGITVLTLLALVIDSLWRAARWRKAADAERPGEPDPARDPR